MKKIKCALLVGLVVLTAAMFMGCDPSLRGTEEPERYFTLQLLEPGTDTVLHSFNLNLSIPNYHHANMLDDPSMLEYTSLKHSNIVHRYEPSNDPDDWIDIGSSFFPIIVSDHLTFRENGSLNTNDMTLVGLLIEDFTGIGTYSLDADEILGVLQTDQLNEAKTEYQIDSVGSVTIEIVEFGGIGGFVKGSALIEDAELYNVSDYADTLTFDIKADFSFERANDLTLKMRKVVYMIDEDTIETDEYYHVGIPVWLIDAIYSEGESPQHVSGWSTELGGSGERYDNDTNPFTMPDDDILLYAFL